MSLQKLQITALFTLSILFSNIAIATAQTDDSLDFSKNVIHGSLGTAIALNSAQVTYDRLLVKKDNGFFKSFYLTFKAGRHVGIDFSGNDGGTGYLASAGVTALTGTGVNHFEIGLGLGYFIDSENLVDSFDPTADLDESTLYPNISIGYRKQTSKGFMFRTGVGVAEWAYVGFGFSF